MKTLILSTGFAALLGAMAIAPANAAPIATHSVVVAPSMTSDVACRTVKRTTFRNGVKRTVTSQECSRPRVVERRVYRDDRPRYRHYDRRPARPGLSINIR